MHVIELGYRVTSAGLCRLGRSLSHRKSQISVSITKRLRFRLWRWCRARNTAQPYWHEFGIPPLWRRTVY